MNRNLKQLYTFVFFAMVAALTGCGGGSDPQTMNHSVGGTGGTSGAGGTSVETGGTGGTDVPDSSCTMSLGGACAPDGAYDSCTGFVCVCGKWDDPESPINNAPCVNPDAGDADQTDSDAGTDANDDVVLPDADAGEDVVTPEEICGNGLDDDHNGKADCQDSACSGETECQEEVCNGIDDNGNGQADEGFECKLGTTAQCQTTCGSFGTMQCGNGCEWSACEAPAENCTNTVDDNCDGKADCEDPSCAGLSACQDEVCNGADDNGNGQVDEGFECKLGTSGLCQTTCGTAGMITCIAGCTWSACTPPNEICGNGIDDNCNLATDCDDAACINLPICNPCEPPTVGSGCANMGEFSECDPDIRCDCNFTWNHLTTGSYSCFTIEVCNGFDDNNNGQVDEIFTCTKNSTQSCTTSCNSIGQKTCSNTCAWGTCQPPVENCSNGVDDDCDGNSDCADLDCAGMLQCQDEICDGADNNGNSQVDEGFECVMGSASVSCTTTCGSVGTKSCLSNCSYGTCQPPVENCSNGVDDDCNGKSDCEDLVCAGLNACKTELCNGIDDNANGQADEGFACVANTTTSCTTACGSQGTSTCSATCTAGTCTAFENCYSGGDEDCDGNANCDDSDCQTLPICQTTPVENCTNGADDDGDGKADCLDTDCVAEVACHDFGTCSTQGAPGVGYSCGTWEQDSVPNTVFKIHAGCANSELDQWAMGDNNGSAKALHLTGNHTWSEVTLPVPGHGGSAMDVICLGQDQVFMSYKNNDDGVVLHWNGSSFVRLMANQLDDLVVMTLWGTGADNLWFFGFDNSPIEALPGYMYHWNGSSLTVYDTPASAGKVFRGYKLFGEQGDLYLAGFEAEPGDWDNSATHKSALLHWDGYSWANVPGSDEAFSFIGIHGSSVCDVMAIGGKHTAGGFVGATFQRNGNQWEELETYSNLSSVSSVVKIALNKFVLQGHEKGSSKILMGTHNGTSVIWSDNFSFKSEGSSFYSAGPTWKVPGTNIVMTAGDGYHGSTDPQGSGTYGFIFRSTCQ
ncbi:MAG: hypothetical protein P1P90_02690 [Patescibacteria group bacterium]|nr:hypothetical protein [Patescibacteria group bacterium]